jgi:hypothetical protein
MARNDTRPNRIESADPAHLRADADNWRALANAAGASALVIALTVSVLSLIEALFSKPASELAQRAPAAPESHGWRTNALRPALFSNLCARGELNSCLAD